MNYKNEDKVEERRKIKKEELECHISNSSSHLFFSTRMNLLFFLSGFFFSFLRLLSFEITKKKRIKWSTILSYFHTIPIPRAPFFNARLETISWTKTHHQVDFHVQRMCLIMINIFIVFLRTFHSAGIHFPYFTLVSYVLTRNKNEIWKDNVV